FIFCFQAEDGIRDRNVTGVQTCALPICTETDELLKRGLKTSIPEAIYNAFSPFFDGQTLYEMYGVLLRAKANVNAMFMVEDYAEEYMNHFFNVIRLYKKGKVKNLASYLYVTWERL